MNNNNEWISISLLFCQSGYSLKVFIILYVLGFAGCVKFEFPYFAPNIMLSVCNFLRKLSILYVIVMTFTLSTLPVTRTPYVFFILPFLYLNNEHYKNEKFLKMSFIT
jgi:hypothetical protein